jgi:LysR family transcriptional regulator, nitrogen assimilation regulatory protein
MRLGGARPPLPDRPSGRVVDLAGDMRPDGPYSLPGPSPHLPWKTADAAMELKQLSYFLSVADAGSFSKAAVLLSVAQPILSRQVKLLETDLGVELLYRNGRGIVLSEAGKILESYARTTLDAVERARTEIAALKAAPQGRVVIAMPPSIGWVLTGPLVRRCREAFPKITLHVVEGFSGHVAEWLSTGRIDVGIVYNASRRASLNTEPLFADDLVLLGPTGNPAGLQGGTVPAARLADGYTVLTETAATQRIGEGRIRSWAIVDPVMTRQLMLATSTQRPMSVATRLVTRLIRDQAASAFGKTRTVPASAA